MNTPTPHLDRLFNLTSTVQNEAEWANGFNQATESVNRDGMPSVISTVECWAANNDVSVVPLKVQGYASVVHMFSIGLFN